MKLITIKRCAKPTAEKPNPIPFDTFSLVFENGLVVPIKPYNPDDYRVLKAVAEVVPSKISEKVSI